MLANTCLYRSQRFIYENDLRECFVVNVCCACYQFGYHVNGLGHMDIPTDRVALVKPILFLCKLDPFGTILEIELKTVLFGVS